MSSILLLAAWAAGQGALKVVPPPNLVWGAPDNGLRFGLLIEDQKEGPPVLRTWLKNETDVPILITSKDFTLPPPTPVFLLRNDRTGMWLVNPPSAYPLLVNGRSWEIEVPANGIAAVSVSRSWFPVPASSYVFHASFSAMRRPAQIGKSVPTPFSLDSPSCRLEIPAVQTSPTNGFGG